MYLLLRLIVLLVFCLKIVGTTNLNAQQLIQQSITEEDVSADYDLLRKQYGKYKIIPQEIEKPVLLALSYFPELQDIHISFVIKKIKAPLLTRPEFYSAIFKQPHKRKYLIVISNQTADHLKEIEFLSLNFNAQVGVLGHELSHVTDFTQRSNFGLLGITFGSLSKRWVDKFEYQTDRKTIDHGLGFQLLSWSNSVRNKKLIKYYTGAEDLSEEELIKLEKSGRERYMRPETIKQIISKHPLYQNFVGLDL